MRRQILLLAIGFVLLLFSFLNPLFSTIYSTVSGRLIDKDTGKGVPDVVIDITEKTSLKSYTTKTDSEGRFFFKEVVPGIYEIDDQEIFCSTPSYYIISFLPSPFEVKKGMNVKNLNIYLQRGGVIEGTIFKEDGVTPIETSGYVTFYPCRGYPGYWNTICKVQTFIQKGGRYKCEGLLKSDSAQLIIMAGGYRFEEVKGIKIEPGKTAKVDVIVGIRSNTIVKGKITDEAEKPLEGVFIGLIPVETPEVVDQGITGTNAHGEYILKGLDGGKYYIFSALIFGSNFESIEEKVYIKANAVNEFNFTMKRKR